MDDTQRRLGNLETSVNQISGDVREIKAVLPHLATKAELKEQLGEVQADLCAIKAVLPHLATKESVKALEVALEEVEGSLKEDSMALRAEMHARDTRNLMWLIGTAITMTSMAYSVARFVDRPAPHLTTAHSLSMPGHASSELIVARASEHPQHWVTCRRPSV